jgi:phosphohistidine phosphatase
MLSSDSQRTRETAALLQKEWANEAHLHLSSALYHAGIEELVDEVAAVPNDVDCLLVLGHNPGWEGAMVWLTGDDVRLTTANAALLEGSGETWPDALAERHGWRIHDVVRPKELPK